VGTLMTIGFFLAPPSMASSKPATHQKVQQKISNPPESSQQTEWDLRSDGSTPEEPEALFFTGLVLAMPISIWAIQRRALKAESVASKRWLE
jgi:hypothetical protein